jgi:hypothetical protein
MGCHWATGLFYQLPVAVSLGWDCRFDSSDQPVTPTCCNQNDDGRSYCAAADKNPPPKSWVSLPVSFNFSEPSRHVFAVVGICFYFTLTRRKTLYYYTKILPKSQGSQ